MANDHMKRCSTLFVTRQMQVKAIVRHHYTPVRLARKKKNDTTDSGRFNSRASMEECEGVQPLWITVWEFLIINMNLQYDLAIPLLGICRQETNFPYPH